VRATPAIRRRGAAVKLPGLDDEAARVYRAHAFCAAGFVVVTRLSLD
jgi:hypothetical protein